NAVRVFFCRVPRMTPIGVSKVRQSDELVPVQQQFRKQGEIEHHAPARRKATVAEPALSEANRRTHDEVAARQRLEGRLSFENERRSLRWNQPALEPIREREPCPARG